MKEILLIARNNGQCVGWFRYLAEKIPKTIICSIRGPLVIDILTNSYRILIRPESEQYYRGMRPDYHYAYRLEANSYLLSTGSKRLRSLDDVVDIVKGGNYDYIRKNKI